MSRLAAHRALVTGASGGLGRAIALRLAKEGVGLVLFARSREGLDDTAQQVARIGSTPFVSVGDVTDPDDRAAALQLARDRLGGLDLLVNNAGVSAHGRFHEASPDRLRQVMEVNLFAAAELTREATPLLAEGGRGCVANVGSILGWRGVPHNAEYSASKFALRGWSEAIRPELAKLGVHVLHASPATIDTDFFDHLVDKRGDLPWRKRRGYPADFVANRIVRGIARRRDEVAIGWSDLAFVRISRHAPWLLDWVMKRYG